MGRWGRINNLVAGIILAILGNLHWYIESQILNFSHFGWFIVGCKILNMTLIGRKIRVGTSFWTGDTSNNGLFGGAQNWYWGETLLALSFLLETLRQLFKQAYLAIHSFGNLVIHPSSYYSHLVRKLSKSLCPPHNIYLWNTVSCFFLLFRCSLMAAPSQSCDMISWKTFYNRNKAFRHTSNKVTISLKAFLRLWGV